MHLIMSETKKTGEGSRRSGRTCLAMYGTHQKIPFIFPWDALIFFTTTFYISYILKTHIAVIREIAINTKINAIINTLAIQYPMI